jgi:hypothetical protein
MVVRRYRKLEVEVWSISRRQAGIDQGSRSLDSVMRYNEVLQEYTKTILTGESVVSVD